MKEEILRALEDLEKRGFIKINEHLNHGAIAEMFLNVFKDMTLRRTIEIFVPKDLY